MAAFVATEPVFYGTLIRELDGVERIFVNVKSEHDPSFEEARWRHYLDTGRASLPQPSTSTSLASVSQGQAQLQAFSNSSSVDSTGRDLNATRRSIFDPDVPPSAVTGLTTESATTNSTCSLCAARLATNERQELGGGDDSQRVGAQWDEETGECGRTTGRGGAETPSARRRHGFDTEHGGGSRRSGKTDRRLRRLEKTVESLSHGMILALTQLKSGDVQAEPRPSHESESVSSDDTADDDNDGRHLSAAFAGIRLSENAQAEVDTMASSLQKKITEPTTSVEVNLVRSLLHAPQLPSTETTTPVASKAGPENAFSCIATGSDGSLFTTSKERSHSQMLSPILKFIASSDVFEFLKLADIHAGLWGTQLFDLFWVLDNLFNVHGGILLYSLRKSLNTMNSISRMLGSDEWSHDIGLLGKLDEVYRKELRPHIHTDGNYNTGAKVAWKTYCFELVRIFSERFPSCHSGHFRDLSESYTGCFIPVITTSYIDDLVTLWTPVHPALLEVTRWFEPFIDYGPDSNRATPLHDATIALRHRACELLSRRGANELEAGWGADSLLQLLREHRSEKLENMQLEMECVMKNVSRDFDAADANGGGGDHHSPSDSDSDSGAESAIATAEEAALVERAKRATGCWQVTTTESPPAVDFVGGASVRVRDALALHEVRVMESYRQRLFLEGDNAGWIRSEVFRVLSSWTDGRKGRDGEVAGGARGDEIVQMKDFFWDQVVSI